MVAKAPTKKMRIAVDFGMVSVGEETARVGIKLDRADVSLDDAEKLLCGRRITGMVQVTRAEADPDQPPLKGMEDDVVPQIKSVFDVKRLGVSPKEITAGLTFSLLEIDVSILARFANKSGWLIISSVAEIEDDE